MSLEILGSLGPGAFAVRRRENMCMCDVHAVGEYDSTAIKEPFLAPICQKRRSVNKYAAFKLPSTEDSQFPPTMSDGSDWDWWKKPARYDALVSQYWFKGYHLQRDSVRCGEHGAVLWYGSDNPDICQVCRSSLRYIRDHSSVKAKLERPHDPPKELSRPKGHVRKHHVSGR